MAKSDKQNPLQPSLLDHVPLPIRELTPHGVYRLQRTKAPAFKKWFGDWEDKSASSSQVRCKNSKPLVLYHGSSHSFRAFDPMKMEEGSKYGFGFYFTDDSAIADGAPDDGDPAEFQGDVLGYRRHNLILSGIDKKVLCDVLTAYLTEKSLHLSDKARQDAVEAVAEWRDMPTLLLWNAMVLEEDPWKTPVFALAKELGITDRGVTYAVFLNIRNPLDLTDKATFEHVKSALAPGVPIESIDDLLDEVGGHNINEYARQTGHDGLTSEFGDDKKARVWVAFEPNQIKAVNNNGTFGSNESNIFK